MHVGVLQLEWKPLKLIRPRREKRLPVILSRDEIRQLLSVTVNLKHKAILTLAYSAGLRRSEVLDLRIQDIDSARMQVLVRSGKGKKDRYTILSKSALKVLRDYYNAYRPGYWLFEGFSRKRYSGTSLANILKKAGTKAGIKKHIYFHCLRHSFATHLLEQDVSIQIIQRLLGHSNASTTCVYLHVQQYSIDKIKSPMDFERGAE